METIKEISVLGEGWQIYIEEGDDPKIEVYNEYTGESIYANSPHDLEVIAKNLLDIANELKGD